MVEMRCVVKKRGVPTYSFAHREGAACPFSVGFRVGFRTRISLRGMKPALTFNLPSARLCIIRNTGLQVLMSLHSEVVPLLGGIESALRTCTSKMSHLAWGLHMVCNYIDWTMCGIVQEIY